jgi:1,4-dihydroxy-2-naphthoate octaprenyltransferase
MQQLSKNPRNIIPTEMAFTCELQNNTRNEYCACSHMVFIAALAAHISVNAFNEYQDFSSGLDLHTRKTPFSGGSGALVQRPDAAHSVRNLAIVALLICISIGVYFLVSHGNGILLVGIPGILLVLLYTPWLNRYPLACLLAPGTGFGLLMVQGTAWLFQGHYGSDILVLALIPFFLSNNLLLLNQYPDLAADQQHGRRHFPIIYGIANSNRVYALFATLACLTIVASVVTGMLPVAGLLALLPAGTSFIALYGAVHYHDQTDRLLPYLGWNVLAAVATPLLLGLILLFA